MFQGPTGAGCHRYGIGDPRLVWEHGREGFGRELATDLVFEDPGGRGCRQYGV